MPKDKKDSLIEIAKIGSRGTIIAAVITSLIGLIGVILKYFLERQSSTSPTTSATTISGSGLFLGITILFLIVGITTSVVTNFDYYRKFKVLELSSVNDKLNLHRIEKYLEKRIQIKQIRDDNNSTLTDDSILLKDYEAQEETLLLEGIIPLLKSLLANGTKNIYSEEIVNIFAKLMLVNTDTLIIELLHQPNPDLQVACVNALGEFKTKQASVVLHKILKNPSGWNKNVVNRSVIAIKKINPPDYFDLLVKLLHNENVSEETKWSFVIPALNEINSEKAKTYVLAYEISRTKGERLEDVLRQIT